MCIINFYLLTYLLYVFPVCLLCSGCMQCFVSLILVVSTSKIDYLERLINECVGFNVRFDT